MPIVQGKLSIQRTAVRKNGWTVKRRAEFLDALSQSCNAREAARVVGMHADSARALKRRDPEFARLWADAIAAGAERLQEELLAHSLNQISNGENPDGERQPGPPVPFDPQAAIAALKARGGFAEGARKAAPVPTRADVDAALMARLEELAARKAKA